MTKAWFVFPAMAGGRVVAAVLLVCGLGARAAELHLTYEQTETTTTILQPVDAAQRDGKGGAAIAGQNPKAEPKTEQTTGQVEFVIGNRYLVMRQNGAALVYDFDGKRMLRRRTGAENWTASSLFGDLGFRIAEYRNRVVLGKALAAGGIKDPELLRGMGDPADLETLFGLRMPGDRGKPVADLKRSEGKHKGWTFRRGGTDAAYFRPSKQPVPAELSETYLRFFVYCVRLHPEIRLQVVETGMVPEELRTTWRNTGTQGETTLVLKRAEVRAGKSEGPAEGVAVPDDATGELLEVLVSSRDSRRWELRATKDSVVKQADEAVAAGRVLDGLLTLVEYQLQSGEDVSSELRRNREAFSRDASCRQFIAAMSQENKEDCERAVETLRKLDRTGLTKAHVLDIHLGDALSSLGQVGEAEKLFLSVLRANPLMAGVWNDLGQLYHRGYAMENAWLCWDAARRLYPEHPMLAGVTALERRLEQDFPEFFLPAEAPLIRR